MQEKWIGRSEGLRIRFEFESADAPAPFLEVFTTRPDTLFGASFMAVAPDHPLAAARAASDPKLAAFIEECRRHRHLGRGDRDGGEARLRYRAARPPSLRCRIGCCPSIVANFILMGYGTGAIFGCPAHDQRDLDFARKYGLPVTPVVLPRGRRSRCVLHRQDEAYLGDGRIINSDFLDGMTVEQAKDAVARRLEAAPRRRRAAGGARGELSACATGASRASATGAARSR